MSINDTILTGQLLEALYKNHLVIPGRDTLPATRASAGTYTVQGRNLRGICVLVDFAGTPFLPEHHLVFLTRLLSACRLSADDIALVNQASDAVQFDRLTGQLHPQILLLFGVPATAIGLSPALAFFENREMDACDVYAFPSLDEINREGADAQGMKKQLWAILKTIFGI